jgi:hypothetical protein
MTRSLRDEATARLVDRLSIHRRVAMVLTRGTVWVLTRAMVSARLVRARSIRSCFQSHHNNGTQWGGRNHEGPKGPQNPYFAPVRALGAGVRWE